MKICVINFSGNVGKSLVSQHLLKPRMKNSHIISVESINSDGSHDEKIKGKRFTEIMRRVLDIEHVIVDVGASNVEDFLSQMKKSIGSQADFDHFVVPTIFKKKQITDTITTIDALSALDIEKERIRVIFNLLDEDSEVRSDFKEIFDCEHVATVSEAVCLFENELFQRWHEVPEIESIAALAHDDTDYRSLVQTTEDKTERAEYITRLGLKRLAIGVEQMLDSTYAHLFR